MLIVIVIVAFFAVAFLAQNYVKNRSMFTCIGNLRLIDGTKAQWASEHDKQSTDTPTVGDLQPYMCHGVTGDLPSCPNDRKHSFARSYLINDVGGNPACKIMPTNHVLP